MKERGPDLFKNVLNELPNWNFIQVGGSKEDVASLKLKLANYSNIFFIPHQDMVFKKILEYLNL